MNTPPIVINAILLGRGRESGVERCIRGLVEALARYGRLPYRIYAAPGSELSHLESDRFQIETVGFPVRSRGLRILWEQTVLPLVLRRRPPALMHAPGYIAPLAAPPPVVLTVYDLVALRFPQWASRANAWHYRCLMPAAIRRAKAVVTPSMTVRHEIIRYFRLPENKVHVIAPAVAPVFWETPPAAFAGEIRERYRLPSRFLLYAGNIEPKKNTEGLLKAYARLCRTDPETPPLVMVGKRAWKSDSFVRYRRELGLASRVRCLGPLPDGELNVIYRQAGMLLMPSWYEGFGLPSLEAMACGTPVIVSTGGALPETVGDAAVRLEPDDTDAWIQTMRALRDDPERRARMIERGRRHAGHYTVAAVAEKHETLYRNIMYENQ